MLTCQPRSSCPGRCRRPNALSGKYPRRVPSCRSIHPGYFLAPSGCEWSVTLACTIVPPDGVKARLSACSSELMIDTPGGLTPTTRSSNYPTEIGFNPPHRKRKVFDETAFGLCGDGDFPSFGR